MKFAEWWDIMAEYIGEESDSDHPLTKERARQVRRLAKRTCQISDGNEACGTCFSHARMLLDEIDAWVERSTWEEFRRT